MRPKKCRGHISRTPILLGMKLTVLFLLAATLSVCAKTRAQNVTISGKDLSLKAVFVLIHQQTGYDFLYDSREIEKALPVTLDVKNAPMEDVLTQCLKPSKLGFVVKNNAIIVKKAETRTFDAPVADELQAPVELPIVRGRIINEKGEPIVAASIKIKGSTRGTVSNENGEFILKNVGENDVLVVTVIGYESRELKPDNSNKYLSLQLKPKSSDLKALEIVSTGYQNVKRLTMAGSVSSIKASDLYLNGTSSLEQALQGKLPGLVVINQSGEVGTRQKTIVRGVSTLSGTQDPVWVVDGIIQSDPLPFKTATLNSVGAITPDNFDYVRNYVGNSIAWLNPYDIEDITVLKDASATAIYGVRAANGVIVINTKKGKAGPPNITYSTAINMTGKVTYDKLDLMNSKERVGVDREIHDRGLVTTFAYNNIGYLGALNDYLFKRTSADEFNRRVKYYETVNVDWFDILFRNPISNSHMLSISGGAGSMRYYGSVRYGFTNGAARGNDNKGYTANFGMSSRVNDKLSISARLSASQNNTDGFYKVNPYTYASTTNREIAVDSAGSDYYYTAASGYKFNVRNDLTNSGSINQVTSVNTNIEINYQPIKGLTFQSLFGISQSNTTGYTYAGQRTEYIAGKRGYDYGTVNATQTAYINSKLPIGGEYNESDNKNATWNWRNSVSYSHIFGSRHAMTIMAGQDAMSSHNTGVAFTEYGYLPERGKAFAAVPLTYTAANTANPLLAVNEVLTDRISNTMGFYSSLNYTYDNRYVLNFSVRGDASNRFGQYTGQRFNPVWAGGLRWNVMNEKWIEKQSWLSGLSLRFTLGYQRNIVDNFSPDLIARMPTTPASQVIDQFTGELRLVVSSLPYGNLRWEKNLVMNYGLDFSLFNNRIAGTLEYYEKRGSDIIVSLPVALEYGVNTMPVNGGNLINRGAEIDLSFVPIRSKNFSWSININSSKTFNELTKVGTQNPTWRNAVSGNLYVKGYPVSGFWAFNYTGINPANGYPMIDLTVAKGGDAVNDPTSFMTYVGKLNPDFTGGLGMNFRYRMFTLSANAYLQLGGKKFMALAYNTTTTLPSEYENLPRQLLQRWTPQNTGASFPGLPDASVKPVTMPDGRNNIGTNYYDMYNYSTARVVNASTLRMNNLYAGYTLPAKLVTRLKCRNIAVSAGVSNPFAIVSRDFKGRDAEVATGQQPRTRTWSMTVNITF